MQPIKKISPLLLLSLCWTGSTYANSLLSIYEQAKVSDPELLSSNFQKQQAFESISSSRSVLLPQINLTAGYNMLDSDNDLRDQNALNAGINFSQELYQHSSWANLDIAEMTARQADSQYAAVQQQLIYRVSVAYFNVLRAQDNLEFIQAEKAAVGRQLEQVKQSYEVGLSAITDVQDAQAQYDAVLANEIMGQNILFNSYEELREITGVEYNYLNILDTDKFSAQPLPFSTGTYLEEAEKKNLSLLASRIALDVAKESISLANSGHMPSLTLSGSYAYTDVSNTLNGFNDGDRTDLNLGLNLVVPIYSGGGVSAQVSAAEYNYSAAQQELERVYRAVTKNVRASTNNVSANISGIKAYEQSVKSAQSALEATQAGFEVGTRTIVDVLDATRRLYSANSSLSTARYDYIISVLALHLSTGALTEQELIDIDKGLKVPEQKQPEKTNEETKSETKK